MSYLIDSDIVAEWLLGRAPVGAELATLRRSGIAIGTVTYAEVLEGILGGRNPRRGRQALRSLLRGVRIIVLSRPIAERAATIRLELRRQKRQVNERALDILVAATAIEHRLTLMTRNTRDYADIPGITLHPMT